MEHWQRITIHYVLRSLREYARNGNTPMFNYVLGQAVGALSMVSRQKLAWRVSKLTPDKLNPRRVAGVSSLYSR